jgi:inner membrane protein involved in colicin E2 resistance
VLAGLGVAHLHQTDFSLFLGAVLALAVLTVVAFVATARGGPDE